MSAQPYRFAVLLGPRHGMRIVAMCYDRPFAVRLAERERGRLRCGRCPGGCIEVLELPGDETNNAALMNMVGLHRPTNSGAQRPVWVTPHS